MTATDLVKLRDIAVEGGIKAGANTQLPVYSVTKHAGFVRSDEYFKKQIFSRDLSSYTKVELGELAYATIHLDEGSIGIAPTQCLISPMYTVFRTDPERVDAKYLVRLLKTQDYLSKYSTMGKGTVHRRKAISFDRLSSLEIPLPSLRKQRRITEILDQAEALRTKRLQAIAKLDTLTQSLFLELFGDLAAIPSAKSRPLQEIIAPDRPISYGILMPGEPQVSGVNYIRVVDMKDGDIHLRNIRKTTRAISDQYRRSLLKAGDLLLSIRGHVGRLAEVPNELDGANITQDTARLAIQGAVPRFIKELLRSPSYQRWMKMHTKGVAVRGLNLGDLKMLPIHLPKLELQKRFEVESRKIDELRTNTRVAFECSERMSSSLQHRAFQGEL